MICTNCKKPYLFISSLHDKVATCKYCGTSKKFKQPSYENYHEKLYTKKDYVRTLKTDPQMKLIFKKLAIQNNDNVLEIGCGVGDYTQEISKITKKTTATDLSIEKAKNRLPKLKFLEHDANNNLPFTDNSFDVIISINLIEHLHNPQKFLKEIRRVLKGNGRLAIATANLDFILHDYFFDKTHLYEWTLDEFSSLVGNHFDISYAQKGSGMFKYYPANFILTKFLKPDLVVIAQKNT